MKRPLRLAVVLLALAGSVGAGCSDQVRPLFVDSISIEPDSVFLRPGERAVFRATPRDSRSGELPDRAPFTRWRAIQPRFATVSDTVGASVTVEGGEIGTTALEVELGRGRAMGFVHTTPPGEISVEIVPEEVDLVDGVGQRLEAILTSPSGDTVSPDGYRISWRVAPDSVLLLFSQGGPVASVFGLRPGPARVTVIVSDFRRTREFVVRPP